MLRRMSKKVIIYVRQYNCPFSVFKSLRLKELEKDIKKENTF